MTIKVLMRPHPSDIEDTRDGISQVVKNWSLHLPNYGIELVKPDSTTFDLRASHAGCTGPEVDVLHTHGLHWSADNTPEPYEHFTNAMLVQGIRNAKAVTVPSPWVAEAFQRDMRFTPYIIPHGVEWKEWAYHHEENEGYVLWNKNRPTDVCSPKALGWLAERAPDMKFLSTFAPLGQIHNLSAIGTKPHAEMKKIVQGAGVYLSTTKETFGIGILEAMASGIPVLSVARGGALDLIEHKVTGYLARNWDDMLEGLWYCVARRDELGAAAREAAKKWTWTSAAEMVAKVYYDAILEEEPTVSVIIPSYNYGEKVGRAIESVLDQTYPYITNIIVVDDGSPDDGLTERVVTEYSERDGSVQYIRQSNAGVANARNTGIGAVNTKYVSCLDADDAIAPQFVEVCVAELEERRTLGIAYTGIKAILPNGDSRVTDWPGRFNYDEQLKRRNQIPTCCVFKREMWERLGGYRQRYAPTGAGAEDAEFWLRCGAYGWDAKKVTDEGLFIYTLGQGHTSQGDYREVDWLAWHPWVKDNGHPFASIATPKESAHLVRQYDEPIISVIIPVGPGHEGMVIDALDSVEAQTFRKWEAIVINDTGNPLDLTAYPYVRLVETEGGMGAGYARNRGIEIMRAGLFVCLDADDYLQGSYLAEMFAAFTENEGDWIFSNIYIQHPDGKIENYISPDWSPEEIWTNDIGSVTCLYTKEMWNTVGGFEEEHNREDWDFHLRLTKAGYCATKIQRPLFTYRHATGKRRDDGSIPKEVERLRKLYPLEELQEMCRGCGKRKAAQSSADKLSRVPSRVPILGQLKTEAGFVPFEYTGGATGDQVLKGKTGRRYIYNSGDKSIFLVHPDDIRQVDKFSFFKRRNANTVAQVIKAQPVPAQVEVAPVVAKPVESPVMAEEIPAIVEETPRIIDVSAMTVAELRLGEYSAAEWQQLLGQELAREKPRKIAVREIKKRLASR